MVLYRGTNVTLFYLPVPFDLLYNELCFSNRRNAISEIKTRRLTKDTHFQYGLKSIRIQLALNGHIIQLDNAILEIQAG